MRSVLILLFVGFAGSMFAQQNVVYSQYMHHGFPLNPAIAGSSEALTVTAGLRRQWVGIDGAPSAQLFSGHSPVFNEKLSVGMVASNQSFGVSRRTGIRAALAYRMNLGQGKLSFGMSGGWRFGVDNWNEVVTTEFDPEFQNATQQYGMPLLGAGMYYYSKKGYVSLSLPSFFEESPTNLSDGGATFDIRRAPLYVNSGFNWNVHSAIQLRPSAMLIYRGSGGGGFDANLMAQYKRLFQVGASYRTVGAWVAMCKFWLNEQFSLAYAAGYWNSVVTGSAWNSHELSIRYDLIYTENATNPRFF